MRATQLRDLPYEELTEKLDEAKEELFNLRFQMATNQLDNIARIKQVRREIGRIATVIREQEIAAWKAGQEEQADG
jgi:large subunit ribosomal protein L29